MKKIKRLRSRLELEENSSDDYNIDLGCCYFHDRRELTQFTDIDDDIVDEFL